ncbi:MAG: FAD-binding protein [Rhodobacteraceae bacterium]|nr:FAD-binding protein [Paracoccaceae bacterium]
MPIPHFALPPHDPEAVAGAVARLRESFGERCQTGASIREQHGHTTTWLPSQPPDAVVFPRTTEEVQQIVRICAEARVPVIGFGTGTSLEGHVNAPAGGISVDFHEMNRVLAVHVDDMDCTVEPGVTRKELNTHLRDRGLFFPVDPGADASLGGMAATRASGTNAVRYGTMRDAVLSLKAVLANGEVVSTGRRARKSAAGYDLTRLIVGSEGTLALITELTLRLHGIPEAVSAAACSFPTLAAAAETAIAVLQYGIPVARMELLDALTVRAVNAYSKLTLPERPLLLLEFHGSEAGVAEQAEAFGVIAHDHGAEGFEWAVRAEDRNRLWQARHDTYWATHGLRPGVKSMSTDICVPISALAECVTAAQAKAAELGLLAPVVGHVGDGNFHVLLPVDTAHPDEVRQAETFICWLNDLAIAHDGTCTGEHGIAQGKAGYLAREFGAEALTVMRAVKRALDPANILNPGKIVDLGNAGPV